MGVVTLFLEKKVIEQLVFGIGILASNERRGCLTENFHHRTSKSIAEEICIFRIHRSK